MQSPNTNISFHFSTTLSSNNLEDNQCILELCSTSRTSPTNFCHAYIMLIKSSQQLHEKTFDCPTLIIPKELIRLLILLHIHKNDKNQNEKRNIHVDKNKGQLHSHTHALHTHTHTRTNTSNSTNQSIALIQSVSSHADSTPNQTTII